MLKIKKSYIFSAFPIFFIILVTRASLDPVLNFTKISGIGFGAILNLVLVLLFLLLFIKRHNAIPKQFFIHWLLFSLITVLSSFWSPDFVNSLRSSFWILTYMSAFFIPFFFADAKRCYESILYLVVLSFTVPLVIGVSEFAINFSEVLSGAHRIKSTFSHPNILAFYLTQVLFAVLALRAIALKDRLNIFGSNFGLFTVGMITILIVLTQTRSAWVVTLLLIGVHCLSNERRLLIPMISACLLLIMFPPITERIIDVLGHTESYYDPYAQLNSFEWRLVVWKSASPWIFDSFYYGYGFNSFSHYFLNFVQLDEDSSFDAHNIYVQYLFDLGIIGLLCYLGLLVTIVRYLFIGKKLHHSGSLVLTCFIAYFLCGLSDNISFYLSFNWYFWLVIGAYLSFVYREVVER